jgi:hypothetical protein
MLSTKKILVDRKEIIMDIKKFFMGRNKCKVS